MLVNWLDRNYVKDERPKFSDFDENKVKATGKYGVLFWY